MKPRYLTAFGLAGGVLLAWTLASPATSPEVSWRLPETIVLNDAAGEDGIVRFDHATHLAFVGLHCTTCHSELFRMLEPAGRMSHEEMDAGGSCGVCHDGKQAPATDSDEACTSCHSGWGPRDPGTLRDVSITAGDSPGPVVFSHASHAGASLGCHACHPDPYPLELAGTPVAATPEGGHDACGRCHDGERAFGLEESPCESCHREEVTP